MVLRDKETRIAGPFHVPKGCSTAHPGRRRRGAAPLANGCEIEFGFGDRRTHHLDAPEIARAQAGFFGQLERAVAALEGWRAAFRHGIEPHHGHGDSVGVDRIQAGDDHAGRGRLEVLADPRPFTAGHGFNTLDDGQVNGTRRHQVHYDARYAPGFLPRRGGIFFSGRALGWLAIAHVHRLTEAPRRVRRLVDARVRAVNGARR